MATTLQASDTLANLEGKGLSVAFGYTTLTDETVETITTGLGRVDFAVASIDTQASGTPGDLVICNAPTQTGTDRGKIKCNADLVGGSASGTTTIRWIAIGIGTRR